MRWLEAIAKGHAVARELRIELDLFESSKALKVRDRLAHVSHGQRAPDTRFEELDQRRLERRLALDLDRDVGESDAHVP